MYLLLIAQPLTGWALLSAADSPVVLVGSIHLPDIAPHSIAVYSLLRLAHTVLAYLLFATFTAHVCAVTFHSIGLRGQLVRVAPVDPEATMTAGPYCCAPLSADLTVHFTSWRTGPADVSLHPDP